MGERMDSVGERIDRLNGELGVWFRRLLPWVVGAFMFPLFAAALLGVWAVCFTLIFNPAALRPRPPVQPQSVQAEADQHP